jgi:hypothetical protein
MTTPTTRILDMSPDEIEDLNAAIADDLEDDPYPYRVQVSGTMARIGIGGAWAKLPDDCTAERIWNFIRTGDL